MLGAKEPLPAYVTRNRLLPRDGSANVRVATPFESFALPRSTPVAVSTKSTLPVGFTAPAATVAVRVTDWP